MTDKQIIIDGVDVSYCPNHYNGWSALHRDHRPMCECGYDRECKPKYFECSHYVKCLEKQLKRKEQECEELKKVNEEKNELLAKLGCPTIATARMKTFTLEQQLDQLKAENEELKEKINSLLCSENCYKYKQAEKLKQALTKIREIAKQSDTAPCLVINHNCLKCKDEPTNKGKRCMEYGLNKIIKEISEVLDGPRND